MSRKLIGCLTGLIVVLLLGAVWWGVVEAANAAPPQHPQPPPPEPYRQGLGEPNAPDISFIDSPTAQCNLPEKHTDDCYIQWQYLYVTASSSQYIISMTVNIDNRMRAYYSGFFQTGMYVPVDMMSPGFKVSCGVPGSGGNPNLGNSYSYTIRARETGGLKAANYGSVYCPADIVPPASINLVGPSSGLPNTPYSFTALIDPVTTTLPTTYTWQVSEQASITETSGISDTHTFTWSSTGPKQISVQSFNDAGSAVITQTINIGYYHGYLPLIITGGHTAATGFPPVGSLQRAPLLAPVLRMLQLAP